MSALVARQPLQDLSMSAVQSGSRRHSSRLQQKDDVELSGNGAGKAKAQTAKKRKSALEEDDDGFVFTRTKNKRTRTSNEEQPASKTELPTVLEAPAKPTQPKHDKTQEKELPSAQDETQKPPKERRKRRMSFSTPGKKGKDAQPVRRSKRLSTDAEEREVSPAATKELPPVKTRKEKVEKPRPPAPGKKIEKQSVATKSEAGADRTAPEERDETTNDARPDVQIAPSEESHSSTKISLPFADTPVISRNKAMREGKAGKGDRRSSLGLRGRRASSLIDSGTSHAVPHTEVQIEDFYKHIESDILEPRRMRQLLTWCATRATHAKPQGTSFEEASALSAARVIEEELLKDLTNRSELSDWFSREDVAATVVPLPEKPHPKNAENTAKIVEVEEQLRRLRAEKEALEALLRPPSIARALSPSSLAGSQNAALLGEEDNDILARLQQGDPLSSEVNSRVNKVIREIEPALDTFADGVHKINQYRIAADEVASQVLATCAEKLTAREAAERKQALGTEQYNSPRRDLSSVLRGLSKTDNK